MSTHASAEREEAEPLRGKSEAAPLFPAGKDGTCGDEEGYLRKQGRGNSRNEEAQPPGTARLSVTETSRSPAQGLYALSLSRREAGLADAATIHSEQRNRPERTVFRKSLLSVHPDACRPKPVSTVCRLSECQFRLRVVRLFASLSGRRGKYAILAPSQSSGMSAKRDIRFQKARRTATFRARGRRTRKPERFPCKTTLRFRVRFPFR